MNPYFYSWTKQISPLQFEVTSAVNDEFILPDGRRVYDFVSTSFQANFGHQFQPIIDRIRRQLSALPIASPKASFELKRRVSDQLDQFIRLEPGKIFYTVSGAESVENALKIARQVSGRKVILARQKSYHGASLGALSVTGDWRNDPHLTYDEGTVRIPEHDEDPSLEKTREIIDSVGSDNIAGVILETISGTNGMSIPPAQWFAGIQELCREHNILLIIDEVLVGFRRCGSDFAFHKYGLKPDMICLSKAISGGYVPFGAVWTSPSIAEYYDNEVLCCGLTNYAHPLGLAALEGVLTTLQDSEFQNQMTQLETCFADQLSQLERRPDVVELRLAGLMAAIYFDHAAPEWKQAIDAGLHLYSKENMTILAPPYVSTPERLRQAIATFKTLLPTNQNA